MICRSSIRNRRMPSLRHVPLMADVLANMDAIKSANAPMSKVDLCVYRARRHGGAVWMVKIFGRHAAEFPSRDEARTFADFAPMLIAQGTCPVCLERHAELRTHIGGMLCITSKGSGGAES